MKPYSCLGRRLWAVLSVLLVSSVAAPALADPPNPIDLPLGRLGHLAAHGHESGNFLNGPVGECSW